MTLRIRYMGNKHALGPRLARLIDEQPPEWPLVDLFCGMCSVGAAVAPTGRHVWGNDVQAYAALAARCQTTSATASLRGGEAARTLASRFGENLRALQERFGAELETERAALRSSDRRRYMKAYRRWRHAGNDEALASEAARLADEPDAPARLCSITFSWGYFGLQQSIELDSIRFALDQQRAGGELTEEQYSWGLLALLQAASVSAATPGHFAQYLSGDSDRGFGRIVRQRARDVWDAFLGACEELQPFGTAEWRQGNRCFQSDALTVWTDLEEAGLGPSVIYADPPYSKDHYSRYYHVLETLVRYDYPSVSGAGRYRPDRHRTAFSVKSEVIEAFESLFRAAAGAASTLVLSYPSNGLYFKAQPEQSLEELLRRYFKDVRLAIRRPQKHSTLGARHGNSKISATELAWVAS